MGKTGTLRLPTAKTVAALNQAEEQKRQKQAESDDKWYVRYPLAALMLFGSVYLIQDSPKLWWVALCGVIVAAFQAREISLIALAFGGIWFLFKGIASLPVSAAIIVGAMIIAAALRKS